MIPSDPCHCISLGRHASDHVGCSYKVLVSKGVRWKVLNTRLNLLTLDWLFRL